MNRWLKSSVLGATAAMALFAVPAFAEIKVAVVDYGRLMEDSPQAKASLEAIRAEFAPKGQKLQTDAQNLKSKEDKLNKDRATMSADQVTREEKDLRDGARDLSRRQQELNDDVNARRNEEMSKLQRTLIEEVRSYARTQSFDLVLADGVIFASQSLDITPAVLAMLQSKPAAAATPPRAATPAPVPAAAPVKPGRR